MIFRTVWGLGSVAGAGWRRNGANWVISYGIGNLEAQLGLSLCERQGTRKPRRTVAGQAVLAEARSISQGIDGLRAKVKGLSEGLEAQVDLAIDVMLPSKWLGEALSAFYAEFPTVALNLHVAALGAVTAPVLARKAVTGVSGHRSGETPAHE